MKIYILLLVLVLGCLIADVLAAEKTIIYSNEDLKKYKSTSTGNTTDSSDGKTAESERKSNHPTELSNDPDKYMWCSRGNQYREQVNQARERVNEISRQVKAMEPFDDIRFTDALRRAQQKLENAERELTQFEQEAYIQGIPPGWLRCQFGY
jgi:hypothetical protein